MIFNEWTRLEDYLPDYGKMVLLLIDDEHLTSHERNQICLMGERLRTDHSGECFRVYGPDGVYELYDTANRVYSEVVRQPAGLYVTHTMEKPAQKLYPLNSWQRQEIKDFAASAVKGYARRYSMGGDPVPLGDGLLSQMSKIQVKNPLDDMKIIKKP